MTPLTSEEQDTRDMRLLASGHDAALNELMNRHAEKIHNYLLRSLQNEEDAADLAQETFVRIYQNRHKFNPGQKFTSWLYSIAANLVRDRFRWRSRHPQISLESDSSAAGGSLGDTLKAKEAAPDQTAQTNERAAALSRAIETLPPELREPLILSVYEGLPHAEIGEVLGCSAKAVETRLYRAKNQLRHTLSKMDCPTRA